MSNRIAHGLRFMLLLVLVTCALRPEPVSAWSMYDYWLQGQEYRVDGTAEVGDALLCNAYVYPNSGWSTVYESKVNSLYCKTSGQAFVEIGYFYEPLAGVTNPKGFLTYRDWYGNQPLFDYDRWQIPSSHVSTYRHFELRRAPQVGWDSWDFYYNGVFVNGIDLTGIRSSLPYVGMERMDGDNGNASFQYVQSRKWPSGTWSYWLRSKNWGSDPSYHLDYTSFWGTLHWIKVSH
ncbi:MAG: hypothetical protein Q8K89_05090 [Actinomycetota bacterium]|nr:hypothetical protein [Actinomycetota bacterium]